MGRIGPRMAGNNFWDLAESTVCHTPKSETLVDFARKSGKGIALWFFEFLGASRILTFMLGMGY